MSREQIRETIRRTDPLNTALRWHGTTARQPYSVPGPNSLWHIGMYNYEFECVLWLNVQNTETIVEIE